MLSVTAERNALQAGMPLKVGEVIDAYFYKEQGELRVSHVKVLEVNPLKVELVGAEYLVRTLPTDPVGWLFSLSEELARQVFLETRVGLYEQAKRFIVKYEALRAGEIS